MKSKCSSIQYVYLTGRTLENHEWRKFKQVSKSTRSVTIMSRLQVFDFCQVKYWMDTAHGMVTNESENSSNIIN
jgi:hypothetical protein